jgi:hypothetical protein
MLTLELTISLRTGISNTTTESSTKCRVAPRVSAVSSQLLSSKSKKKIKIMLTLKVLKLTALNKARSVFKLLRS